MIGVRGLAIASIVICFLEIICGITSAVLIGSAKWHAASYVFAYTRGGNEVLQEINFDWDGVLVKPINYTLYAGIFIAVLAFVRLLLHVSYLFRDPTRAVAITDLAVTVWWLIVTLAGLIVLPERLDIFRSYRGYNSYYTDWVMKLRSAWIFLLLAFLLWMASMFLAALVLEQAKRRTATASKAPDYPDPSPAKIKQKDSTSPVVSASNIV